MKILIGCEESQTECIAFRARGHEAYSCDIQECSGNHPEWHIHDDVLNVINDNWDLAIFHPPCTYLSNVSSHIKSDYRFQKMLEAKEFFMQLYNCNIPKFAIENPVPKGAAQLPKYQQIIEPYFFGHPCTKKTCLWLHNLPLLYATNIVKPKYSFVYSCRSSVDRSKSFPGVAEAMADQWPGFTFNL